MREIKVFDRGVADSLLLEIKRGADFSSLAKRQSGINPVEGSLFGPFTKKHNAKYFNAASLLEVNDISPVISLVNNSFSIIQLVEKIPKKPVDLNVVYVQIESLLTKEKQENSKERGIGSLINKYKISQNTSFLYSK